LRTLLKTVHLAAVLVTLTATCAELVRLIGLSAYRSIWWPPVWAAALLLAGLWCLPSTFRLRGIVLSLHGIWLAFLTWYMWLSEWAPLRNTELTGSLLGNDSIVEPPLVRGSSLIGTLLVYACLICVYTLIPLWISRSRQAGLGQQHLGMTRIATYLPLLSAVAFALVVLDVWFRWLRPFVGEATSTAVDMWTLLTAFVLVSFSAAFRNRAALILGLVEAVALPLIAL
jgi:hypothetical protein